MQQRARPISEREPQQQQPPRAHGGAGGRALSEREQFEREEWERERREAAQREKVLLQTHNHLCPYLLCMCLCAHRREAAQREKVLYTPSHFSPSLLVCVFMCACVAMHISIRARNGKGSVAGQHSMRRYQIRTYEHIYTHIRTVS